MIDWTEVEARIGRHADAAAPLRRQILARLRMGDFEVVGTAEKAIGLRHRTGVPVMWEYNQVRQTLHLTPDTVRSLPSLPATIPRRHSARRSYAPPYEGPAVVVETPTDLSILDQLGGLALVRAHDDHPRLGETEAMRKQALNTILYGPPGTGKTYATARRAVELCDSETPADEHALRERYRDLIAARRIEFITFHQSYGYEEFVEGLRPETGEDAEHATAGFRLVAVDGALKRIAKRARSRPRGSGGGFDETGRRVFKVSLGRSFDLAEATSVRDVCLDEGCVMLGYGGEIDWSDPQYESWDAVKERWQHETGKEKAVGRDPNVVYVWQIRTAMRPGDVVLASRGNRKIQAIGLVDGDYEFRPRESDGYHHRRKVRWCWQDPEGDGIDVADIYAKGFSQQSIYQVDPKLIRWETLRPYLAEHDEEAPPPPHVLIIDEINRANVSKVFGELITLLEEDKRAGAPNETAVVLPHSGETFALPANLHLLGTMNTADRSIALLDTALRRRFVFEECAPDPDRLEEVEGIDLPAVLRAINDRLEWFIDRDHLIGHAWFMGARTRKGVDDVMRCKVIPLLVEYFHDDWSKVQAVLGGTDDFVVGSALKTPPGFGGEETRWRWRIRAAFPEGAYHRLVAGGRDDENSMAAE